MQQNISLMSLFNPRMLLYLQPPGPAVFLEKPPGFGPLSHHVFWWWTQKSNHEPKLEGKEGHYCVFFYLCHRQIKRVNIYATTILYESTYYFILVVAWKEEFIEQQLGECAAQRPDINGIGKV